MKKDETFARLSSVFCINLYFKKHIPNQLKLAQHELVLLVGF